jgi:hypothetical protein
VKCIERGGLIRWGTILPTSKEETAPLACQRAHSGLMGFSLVALLLVIDPRPAGRPERCGGPLDARVPAALGTREAPVAPGLLAAACGDRCDPGLLWPGGGGGRALPLCATGDVPPGGEDGPRAWERLAQEESRLALRALRDGVIKGRNGRQGAPETAQALFSPLVLSLWAAAHRGRYRAKISLASLAG